MGYEWPEVILNRFSVAEESSVEPRRFAAPAAARECRATTAGVSATRRGVALLAALGLDTVGCPASTAACLL